MRLRTPRNSILFAVCVTGIVVACAIQPSSATVVFNDGLVHSIDDDTYAADTVNVDNSLLGEPTTLNVLANADIGRDADPENSLQVFGTSFLNMSGGSTVGDVQALEKSLLTITGGTIGEDLHARGSSRIEFLGGSVDSDVRVFDEGVIRIFGGHIAVDGAVDGLLASDDGVIYLYGTDFNYPLGDIPDTSGTLSGTLMNGNSLEVEFSRSGNGRITLIPEPAEFVLLAIATPALLRRYR